VLVLLERIGRSEHEDRGMHPRDAFLHRYPAEVEGVAQHDDDERSENHRNGQPGDNRARELAKLFESLF
jgi:hypothetical protein